MSTAFAPNGPKAMSTPAEAQAVATHLSEVMDALLTVVEQETDLVRAGRIRDAAKLEQSKSDLARLYFTDAQALKANARFIEMHQPALLKTLRQSHDHFHAQLQVNLTVLATAHAVAESIVRGVAQEVNRQAAPQVYGASGRPVEPGPRNMRPIATYRAL